MNRLCFLSKTNTNENQKIEDDEKEDTAMSKYINPVIPAIYSMNFIYVFLEIYNTIK